MGFFERLFKKKEMVEQVFSIEDAEIFLSKTFDEKFQPLKESAVKAYHEMQSVADDMQANLKMLASAEFKDMVDSTLLQNVVGHRKSFILKMGILVEQAKKPMQPDFDSILQFGKSISFSISETDSKTVVDYAALKELFEKEAGGSIENFKAINRLSKKLEDAIKDKKEFIVTIKNSQSDLKSIKDGKNVLIKMEEELKNLEASLSSSTSNCESAKEELEKFLNGEEWNNFNGLLDRKKSIEEEISNVKSQTLQDVARIERPLKKLKNLVDNGVVKVDNEKILVRYVNSTLGMLVEEGNAENIKSILTMVQDKISDGMIELKDKEKYLSEIRWIVENNVFEDFLGKYLLLANNLEKLEKSISEHKAPGIKIEMENQLENLERRIEATKMEIGKSKKQIEKLKIFMGEKKNTLEESLSNLVNKKISVSV